jgi:hypothetical protein
MTYSCFRSQYKNSTSYIEHDSNPNLATLALVLNCQCIPWKARCYIEQYVIKLAIKHTFEEGRLRKGHQQELFHRDHC